MNPRIKNILVIILILILGFAAYKYFSKKDSEPFVRKVYVLKESHYYLYKDDAEGSITYFTNDPEFKLITPGTRAFIYDENVPIRFIVGGLREVAIHNETYEGEMFYGRKIYFRLPETNATYTMPHMMIEIYQSMYVDYFFDAGTLHVEYLEDYDQFPLRSIEATQNDKRSIKDILLGVNQPYEIESIHVGPYEIPYTFKDNQYILHMVDEIYMLSETYVLIKMDGKTYNLPQFKYFFSYMLLSSQNHNLYLI